MSDTQNSSFSLLNQKEIDSLIGFLSDQKNSLNSDVLSQTSIDKLIKLISSGVYHKHGRYNRSQTDTDRKNGRLN